MLDYTLAGKRLCWHGEHLHMRLLNSSMRGRYRQNNIVKELSDVIVSYVDVLIKLVLRICGDRGIAKNHYKSGVKKLDHRRLKPSLQSAVLLLWQLLLLLLKNVTINSLSSATLPRRTATTTGLLRIDLRRLDAA
jgi:hypothetical protein